MTALSPTSALGPDLPDPLDPRVEDYFEMLADSLDCDLLVRRSDDAMAEAMRTQAVRARADHVRALFHTQHYADAAQALERVLMLDPTRAELRYLRARLYERSGRISAALAELDGLERAGHRSALVALLRAACHETAGEREPAVRALTRAAALAEVHPAGIAEDTAPWRLWRDPVLEQETTIVRAALERRLAVEPNAIDVRLAMAELSLGTGQVAEAGPHLDVARSIGPSTTRAELLEGRGQLARGAAGEAAKTFDHAITRFGEFADLRLWAGLAYERAGNVAAARHAFERALERNRCYAMAWQALALLRLRMGNTNEAARVARQATVRHRERSAFSGPLLAAAAAGGDPDVVAIVVRHAALHPGYLDLLRAALVARRAAGTTHGRAWAEGIGRPAWAGV